MELNLIEIIGYLASFIVFVSLMMSSVLRLRWINLIGAGLMSGYGILINAWPVFFMNFAISLIDIYYLFKIYRQKDYFKLLRVKKRDKFLNYFLKVYSEDIKKFFPDFVFDKEKEIKCYTILRNVLTAGVFIGERVEGKVFLIHLDYVTPEYRGYKPGYFIYKDSEEFFYSKGYQKFRIYLNSERHRKYIERMGFVSRKDSAGNICYERRIESKAL